MHIDSDLKIFIIFVCHGKVIVMEFWKYNLQVYPAGYFVLVCKPSDIKGGTQTEGV
jgi:hypothetical protein